MGRTGVFKGVVTRTADPEGLGRLKAQVPQIFGPLETEWAWPAVPNIRGVAPLKPGDPVWITFEGGDTNKPVWIGTWAKVGSELDDLPGGGGGGGDDMTDDTLTWMIVAP